MSQFAVEAVMRYEEAKDLWRAAVHIHLPDGRLLESTPKFFRRREAATSWCKRAGDTAAGIIKRNLEAKGSTVTEERCAVFDQEAH